MNVQEWVKAHFSPQHLSPTDIVRTKVRQILRADALLSGCVGGPGRIKAVSRFIPYNFALVPSILVWPESATADHAVGSNISVVTLSIGLRFWEESIEDIPDWAPSIDTAFHRIWRTLENDKQLLHRGDNDPGNGEPLCDPETSFGPMQYREDSPDDRRIAMTMRRTATYHMRLDPDTGLPYAMAHGSL